MRFLLVEDDPSHVILMREHLSPHGAEVENVNTVAGAIRILGREQPYDLVLLDQDLPDGHGFEVQEFLCARSDAPPVIFVTSDDQAEHAVRAMQSGARSYVIKRPNYLIELDKEVSKVLQDRGNATAMTRTEYEERESRTLAEALERNDWNVSATARELGIGRGKLRSRMAALGIDD
ncbi:MAG: DNA-binding response regulator [bacterium]|nr:DNA-binding response regulator [bacterium]MCP5041747.1 DNA-binding response regulator [bacterium]